MTTENTSDLHAAIARMQVLMTQAADRLAQFNDSLAESHTKDGIVQDVEVQLILESDTDLIDTLRAAALAWDQRHKRPQGLDLQTGDIAQKFEGLPLRKLRTLLSQGWVISGVSIESTREDGTKRRGAVTTGGMALWWHETAQPAPVQPVAFAVYWGLELKRLHSLHRRHEDAQTECLGIKSFPTGIRPLIFGDTTPATQPAVPSCVKCGAELGALHVAAGDLDCGWPARVQPSDCIKGPVQEPVAWPVGSAEYHRSLLAMGRAMAKERSREIGDSWNQLSNLLWVLEKERTSPPAAQLAPEVTNLAAAIEYADARWSDVDVPIEWARHFADAIGKLVTTPPAAQSQPYATFASNSVASAVPCKHFALLPYRMEPMNDKFPDGLQCVMNANGFNCLSFTDCPGAKFAPKEIAQEIVSKWNGVK